ncbi:MAG: sugar ABC transporter permease [Clostridiaceae bacterium]|nr:sugar ABC transporter permease [Clostridiaceae bacterium]
MNRLTTSLRKNAKLYWKNRFFFLLFLPAIAHYIIFKYIPIYGVTIAFKDYIIKRGIMGSPWVGLENFRLLFMGDSFMEVVRNTVLISIYQTIIAFPMPIIFAIMLNEVYNSKLKKTIQTISYLPHFLSWVVLAGIFIEVLSPSRGPINMIITSLGFKPIYFLGDPKWFRTTLVGTYIWQGMGWGSIVYLAGLTSIDPSLYEAATVDGAGRFKKIWHITIPGIVPIITIMFIFAMGKIIKDDFDQVLNLYNPAVYSVGDVISTYVYRSGLVNLKYSFAAAADLFKNVIAFVMVVGTNYITRKINDYGLW